MIPKQPGKAAFGYSSLAKDHCIGAQFGILKLALNEKMKKRYLLPISLILLHPGFSEETESKSSKNQRWLADKQAELDRKEKQLSDQEEAYRAKEGQLVNRKLSLLEQMEAFAAEDEEVATKEQLLLERESKEIKREKQLASREQELADIQQLCAPQELLVQDSAPANYDQKLLAPGCRSAFHTMHLELRHTEARGIGYKEGYTTLEGFGIYDRNHCFMPFLDLRGHLFDNGKWAGNVGIGGRSYFSSLNHFLGYYCYYDVRQDRHHLTAQQVSPGIEFIGSRMEYRLNGYFPVAETKSHQYGFKFDAFDGHRILLKSKRRDVMIGGDAEVGAHLTQSTKYDVYAGAGPYYFSSSHASAWGGKVRLLGRYKEYISLEASYSYDHLFRNVVQGTITLNLPFGSKLKKREKECSSRIDLALSRLAFAPYRFEIPVVKKISTKDKAINPATGDPWNVWFVNNTSSSEGTFESPFPTLLQAQNASAPNDMIYVFPGDGTTTGMDMGITLQDGQTFFGSGIAQRISTTKGKIKIPAFSNSLPMITSSGINVVTLGNGNEVSGMNIMATTSRGIRGNGVNGTTINNNNVFGNPSIAGISIFGLGEINIKNNQVSSSLLTGIGIFAGAEDATFIKVNISNNSVIGFLSSIDFQPVFNPTSTTGDITIQKNFMSNFGNNGVSYPMGMPNSIVRIIGNVINNNASVGSGSTGGISISVNNYPDSGNVLVQNNTITTTTTNPNINSLLVEINGGASTHLNVDIDNNTMTAGTGAGSVGINVRTTANNGTICASLTNNTVIQQAAGINDFQITTNVPTATNSIINVDDLSGNISSNFAISGNVNFVPEGTCE
jgi:hypothetical protein